LQKKVRHDKAGKAAIIFEPVLAGHRQLTVAIFSQFLSRAGYAVIVATNKEVLSKWVNHLTPLGMVFDRYPIRVVYTRNCEDDILDLERTWDCTLSIFPVGVEMVRSLGRLRRNHPCRRVAVFAYSEGIYFQDSCTNPIRLARECYRWIRRRAETLGGYRRRIPREFGLDLLLFTDSNLCSILHDPRCFYMPEVYSLWDYRVPDETEEIGRLCSSFESFLKRQSGRKVVLFFGGFEARKGYDVLLKFATQHSDTAFVACGRRLNIKYKYDVPTLEGKLAAQDRLFDAQVPFYAENRFIDLLFSSIDLMVLPYAKTFGPSGNLLKALSYGKPVLVPNVGWMASTVRKYGLGATYRYMDFGGMCKGYRWLAAHHAEFTERCLAAARAFDQQHVENAIAEALSAVDASR
jgi:glycosyltransferase involved in cell wall biosynthesis